MNNNFSDFIEEILSKTNRGRDLIEECYPIFAGVGDNKKVKLRTDERNASAHIHLFKNKYILKDFGSNEKGKNGIEVYAHAHGIDFKEAVFELCERYGIDTGRGNITGPRFEKRPLTLELKKGERKYVYKSEFTTAELSFLGPNVSSDTVHQLGWHSVDHIIICKDNEEIVVYSTSNYPIFARDMHDAKTGEIIGHKIYQPRFKSKGDGKDYKFGYYPTGLEPGTYTHGLYELEHVVDEKGGMVNDAAICCGERDALVLKSMGIHPIWMNSETAEIPLGLYSRLKTLAKNIFYFPDIDETGKRMAMKNIRLYPELKTVWLPDEMMNHRGDQYKPCKDLRDWVGLHRTKNEFTKLLNTANSYQFWYKNEKGNLVIDTDNLLYFYRMNGYYRVWNPITEAYEFVHKDEHKVKKVNAEQIRQFLLDFVQNQHQEIRNLVLKNRKNALEQLKDLPVRELDFTNATVNSQIFCFANTQVMVTDEDIYEIDASSKCCFWEEKIIKHNFTRLPPMFDVEKYTDNDGKTLFIIHPNTDNCKLFSVLLRSSMIYWKKTESGMVLTFEEELEENKCLSSKMYVFGHLLHRHKDRSRGWAPTLLDNNTRIDSKVAEGGSAKSFLLSDVLPALGYNVVRYVAKDNNPLKDDFIYDQVTTETDVFFIDECPDKFGYDKFNSPITDAMVVNKKNKTRFTINFKESPKFAFASNYPLHDFGGSSTRRLMPALYSDYYHYASVTNGHPTTRTIRDDFGMILMGDDYSEEDWNRDINFALQCEQFYLSVVNEINDKLSPDMTTMMKRHNSTEYDDQFDGWANEFFSDSSHLNRELLADTLVLEYNRSDRFPKIEKKELKRQLKAWVACREGLEFNPLDKCNDKVNRRIKTKYNNCWSESFYVAGKYDGE